MSTRMGRLTYVTLVISLIAILLAGCQGAAATQAPAASQPTVAATEAPATNTQPQGGYPAGDVAAAQPPATDPSAGYPAAAAAPADNGAASGYPAGAPAAPNQAKVVAELLEQKPGEQADQVILHVKVISAEPAGPVDFVTKLVNQEVDLIANASAVPQLAVNDKFEAQVSYNGDENGGKYFADQIKKQ